MQKHLALLYRLRAFFYNARYMPKSSIISRKNGATLSRALRPGLGVKRWIVLLMGGVTLAGLGLAVFFEAMGLAPYLRMADSRGLWLAGGALLGGGLALAGLAVWLLNRRIVHAVVPDARKPRDREVVSSVLAPISARRTGPKVVVIGGGTGMPQLLRGLRAYTDHITAVVTVADDGGSSGRLRRQMGMLPPGDFRNNIAALSEAEELMTRLFQYRFGEGDVEGQGGSELAGHSFGNLFITTMAAISGSFEAGIAESSRVLAVRGRILPSTLENVTLCAEIARPLADGGEEWIVVEGESNIPATGGRILRVFLQPDTCARIRPSSKPFCRPT